MSLEQEDIRRIAHLARLAIDESDISRYVKDLSAILSFVEQMNTAETKGVVPMAHPMDVSQRLRVDEVTEDNQREKFQAVAPLTESGYYLVPKVIE